MEFISQSQVEGEYKFRTKYKKYYRGLGKNSRYVLYYYIAFLNSFIMSDELESCFSHLKTEHLETVY